MKLVGAYLRKIYKPLILFVAVLAVFMIIYGLYGLPWGPAAYAALISSALFFIVGIVDFYYFAKRLRQMRRFVAQAKRYMGELPCPAGEIERLYQVAAQELSARSGRAEEAARQQIEKACQYYLTWSHQIKTPLAAMRLLLQEEPLNKRAMEQELFKTEQYVYMALAYQNLAGGGHDLVLQEYSLEKIVKQAVKKTAGLFIHSKVALELAPIDANAITDAKWLAFVIEQLLTNAVKYTPAGTVKIFWASETATLAVEDNGIGILPEDLPRVTEWGYTGVNGRLEKQSTGIGLFLCTQVLKMLGHSMQIKSQVRSAGRDHNSGTCVLLNLKRSALENE